MYTNTRDEKCKIILEKYKNGSTAQEIGDEYGISRERVCQIIRREDKSAIRGRGPIAGEINEDMAISLRLKGKTLKEIALTLGVHTSDKRLRNILRDIKKPEKDYSFIRCPKCNLVKPRDMFYKCSTQKRGVQAYCKVCMDAAHKEYNKRIKEKSTLSHLSP